MRSHFTLTQLILAACVASLAACEKSSRVVNSLDIRSR
jgi:hypothetical protein